MSTLSFWPSDAVGWAKFLTAALVLFGTLWKRRYLLDQVRRGWLYFTGVNALSDELRYVSEQVSGWKDLQGSLLREVQQIRGELQPNGGSSLHDVVHGLAAALRARDDRDHDPLFWTDDKGRLTHVNRAYLYLSGRTREELVGSGWVNFVAHPDRERVQENWRRAVAEARDFDDTFRVLSLSGQVTTVRCVATRLLHGSGRLLGYYGQLRAEEVPTLSSR